MPMSDYIRGLRSRLGPELLLVPSVTGLVFDPDDGRILLVRVADGGVWVAPGGAIDPDEAPQDAVVREVWEETGLLVEPVRLCGVFGGPQFRVTYDNGDQNAYVTSVFECRRLGGELRADQDEVVDVRFFSAAQLQTIELSRAARLLLPSLMRERQRPWIPPVTWQPPVHA